MSFESGKVEYVGPLESEFNDFLKTLGIDSLYAEYSGSNYIWIWVVTVAEVQKAKEIINLNFEQIISHYKGLLAKHKHPGSYDKYPWAVYCVSNVYSYEIA